MRHLIIIFLIFCFEKSFSQMVVGSYVGNSNGATNDNRNITGLGGTPSVVIIKGNTTQQAIIRSNTMSGDASKEMVAGSALTSNWIQGFVSGGFQVGTDARVNSNTVTYYYIAFANMAGYIATGSYTGSGAGQSVSGVGFSPEYVIVIPSNTSFCYQRASLMGGSYDFGSNNAAALTITSLNADGFSVGVGLSTSTIVYHWVAFNRSCPPTPPAGWEMEENTYTGDGTFCSSLIDVGNGGCTTPEWLIVRGGTNCGPNCSGSEVCGSVHRTSQIAGSCAGFNTHFFSASADLPIDIGTLGTNIAVSANTPINCTGETYHWIAFNASGSLLPIQLISFSGFYEDGNVFLNWKTASEQNNDYFTIERSFDAQTWMEIGKLKGAGNSSSSRVYEFIDSELKIIKSELYYRLKQTDYDGKFEYFAPVSVNPENEAEKTFQVFPNPVSLNEPINMLFESPRSEKKSEVTIKVFNLLGEKIYSEAFDYSGGEQLMRIQPKEKLNKGIYFVHAILGNKYFFTKKLIIVD